jgi:hypothetical protein
MKKISLSLICIMLALTGCIDRKPNSYIECVKETRSKIPKECLVTENAMDCTYRLERYCENDFNEKLNSESMEKIKFSNAYTYFSEYDTYIKQNKKIMYHDKLKVTINNNSNDIIIRNLSFIIVSKNGKSVTVNTSTYLTPKETEDFELNIKNIPIVKENGTSTFGIVGAKGFFTVPQF